MTSLLLHSHQQSCLPEIFTLHELNELFKYLRKPTVAKRSWNYVAWCRERDHCIIRIMYEMALRPQEAIRISEKDIDLVHGILFINPKNAKTRKGRKLFLTVQAHQAIDRYLNHPLTAKYRSAHYLFPTNQGGLISNDGWRRRFLRIQKAAGVWRPPTRHLHGHLTSYSLRHTRATQLYLVTKNIKLVADFLGHSSLESTTIYIHLNHIMQGYLLYLRNSLYAVNRMFPT